MPEKDGWQCFGRLWQHLSATVAVRFTHCKLDYNMGTELGKQH